MSETIALEEGATPSPPESNAKELEEEGDGDMTLQEGVACDCISIDRSSCFIGETVMVVWEICTRSLHERDFIGMFEVDEEEIKGMEGDHMTGGISHMIVGLSHMNMDKLLDYRVRGDTSVCGGQLHWLLNEDIFPKRKSCD